MTQDVESDDRTQEALSFLKILARGEAEIREGRTRPVRGVLDRLEAKLTAPND